MLLFSQAGAFAPPRVLARRSSMLDKPYLANELKALAIKMAYYNAISAIVSRSKEMIEALTSLAKRTVPPTPFDSVLSIARTSMIKSTVQRIQNREPKRMWKRTGGPGYGT